jgi:hypothetical protein
MEDLIEINTENAEVLLAIHGYLTLKERGEIIKNVNVFTDKFEKERKKLRASIPPKDEVYLIGIANYGDKEMRLILGCQEDYQRILNEKRSNFEEIILGGTLGGRVI